MPKNLMKIRMMTRADVPRLVELENELYITPWTAEGFDIGFGKYAKFYVAEIENEVMGYIGWISVGDEVDIAKVSIAKKWQGKKLSKILMEHAKEIAKLNRKKYITLEVRVSNTSARSLYEKCGFTQVGVRKNYYENEDGIVYRLDL